MSHPQRVVCCTIKHSPADFQVTEIDPDGALVTATGYSLPVTAVSHSVVLPAAAAPAASQSSKWDVSASNEPLTRFLSNDCAREVQLLAESTVGVAAGVPLGTFEDKGVRGALRCAVRWHHPNLVTTLDGSSVVAVRDQEVFPALAKCVGDAHATTIVRASIIPDANFHLHVQFLDAATKDDRRDFHAAFKKACSGLFSVVREGAATITARRRNTAPVKRTRDDAPPVFTHVVVHKFNVETQRMKELIASRCDVSDGHVCVAGMKDRRAATWQRASVSGDRTSQLGPLPLRLHDCEGAWVEVSSASLSSAPVALGDLGGNQFRVVMRCTLGTPPYDGDAYAKALQARLSEISRVGMLNMFGAQRFGRGGLPGIAILKGDWAEAVDVVLNTAPPDALAALNNKGDFSAFRKAVNPRTHRDAHMMGECLLEVGRTNRDANVSVDLGDMLLKTPAWHAACHSAVLKVPYHLRQLWLHAAQSHIFNKALDICWNSKDEAPVPSQLPLVGPAVHIDDTTASVLSSLFIDQHVWSGGNVAGVPLRGSMRDCVVMPSESTLTHISDRAPNSSSDVWVEACFTLPSSSYATVLVQHLVGCEPVDAVS